MDWDPFADLTMRSSQWFDDWREWVYWLNQHDLTEVYGLEREKVAEGRQKLPLGALVRHYAELSGRAEAAVEAHNQLCSRFGLSPEHFAALPAREQVNYVPLPDSPLWGRVRGVYIRRRAFRLLVHIMHEEAAAPLLYRVGVRCPGCGKHYPGDVDEAAPPPRASDIQTSDQTGLLAFQCIECSCVFVSYRGREVSPDEARRLDESENAELAAALSG